ncbi:MAG: ABC transporter permease [Lachnospiraceae bacterium]|nr:ABC transporter permease [Lachnospiraceae bacterium]
MNKLYARLAWTNVKNSSEFYFPYFLSGIFTIAMFYTMAALVDNDGLEKIPNNATLFTILGLGMYVVGIFAVIFLFYTNSFIIKRRKKEIGVYNILGMEKKHIAKVLFIENMFSLILSVCIGLITGILFNKLMIMLLYKLTGLKHTIEFVVSVKAIEKTILLFTVIYILNFIYDMFRIKLANPIELLHGSNVGEKEPKTKILMTMIGIICIGIGYYISIVTESPLDALNKFFLAVLLVILGTYCLFTAGSIALLKLLRKNKNFYYKTKNFTAVSGLIFRMKQNAVGLSNICILSTMVLVTLSTTICMYFGKEDELNTRYPTEITINAKLNKAGEDSTGLLEEAESIINDSGRKITDVSSSYNFTVLGVMDGNKFQAQEEEEIKSINDAAMFQFVTRETYKKETGIEVPELQEGTIALAVDKKIKGDSIVINGRELNIQGYYNDTSDFDYLAGFVGIAGLVIVNDTSMLSELHSISGTADFYYDIYIDIDGTDKEKLECERKLGPVITNTDGNPERSALYKEIYMESREEHKKDFYALYGGLFFIGLLLGSMFLMITVLVIFYKQISEGYDDKERFEIMEKVGMSNSEVKSSIQTQVRIVFFLPLIMAGIHVAASFPIVKRILMVFNLTNTSLFICCMSCTMLVFAVIYFMVFKLTSAKYYRILMRR